MASFNISKGDIKVTIDGGGNIIIDGSQAKERFKEYANSEAKRLALKAREEICNEYMNTINDFYAEFTPKVWKRQHGYYKTYTPFYENSHGTIFYGGIVIHNAGMPEDHYVEGPEAALGTLLLGKHGPVWGYGPSGLPVQSHMEHFVQYLASYISL